MSYGQPIRDGLRNLFVAAKSVIAPMPEADLPYMRHEPLDQDSDTEYWSDRRYLEELKNDIFAELREGAYLWEMPLPVEGVLFWNDLGCWPDDIAATQLACWRMDTGRAA